MHPTLVTFGPWTRLDLPGIFAFFLCIVAIWTWLERRGRGQRITASWGLALEIAVQAAIPTFVTYVVVNRVGPVALRSYGLMMLGAFVAAFTWMYFDRDRYGFSHRQVLHLSLLGFAGGIVGGRVGYVLLSWGEYAGDLHVAADIWRGGLSWHGGLAGGLLVLGIAAPLMGASFARIFDLAAPGLAVGYAVARVGCFLNGCCYGHECSLPWAVTFPQSATSGSPAFPAHPTQLYSVIGTLGFTLPLLLLLTPWLCKPFDRFLGFLVLSSVVRYVVEIFRRGATGEIWAPMPIFTVAQAASIGIILVAGVIVTVREWPFRREETLSDEPAGVDANSRDR
jgi:phosphatidylglycerol---prolipoprotein diacylglyceryl transferase